MEESKPFSFPFYYRQRVENGWFTELKAAIMVDRKKGREAMLEKDETLARPADMAYVFYLQGKRDDNIEVKCEYA
ncbi:hypothetical protein QC762_0059170 [Podospora pseudocomata]|uniref:Uncharacterized protein n=1 Tax=Podospora pseudocomata TaxID=2093779 RepID=A0ABR0GKP1_9PEZI|nr:hypothetical protein QC762_0059170 [Podospora pseudocomata]